MLELRERSARWLFHEHVLAPLECEPRSLIVKLRWCADGDGIKFGRAVEHVLKGAEIGDAGQLRIAARGSLEREGRIGGNARNMLVTCDLAHTNDTHTNRLHSPSPSSRTDRCRGSSSKLGQFSRSRRRATGDPLHRGCLTHVVLLERRSSPITGGLAEPIDNSLVAFHGSMVAPFVLTIGPAWTSG